MVFVDQDEMEQIRQMEQLKAAVLGKILSKEARERMGRIKVVKPDLASQLELYLVQLYQAGKIQGQISDEQLKAILEMLSSNKRFKIIKK